MLKVCFVSYLDETEVTYIRFPDAYYGFFVCSQHCERFMVHFSIMLSSSIIKHHKVASSCTEYAVALDHLFISIMQMMMLHQRLPKWMLPLR